MEYSLKVGLFSPYDFAFPSGVNDHILNLHSQLLGKNFEAKIVAPASTESPNDHVDFIPMGRPVSIPSGGSVGVGVPDVDSEHCASCLSKRIHSA